VRKGGRNDPNIACTYEYNKKIKNKIIKNWQRPLWEDDWEVVKRSDRDEPMWVAIHMCMEAMIGISLYRYSYLKLAKMLCLSYLLCFSSKKLEERAEKDLPGSKWGGGKGEEDKGQWSKVSSNVYTYE
jgi:hypothetical protein